MNRKLIFTYLIMIGLVAGGAAAARAQSGRTTFTGTVLLYPTGFNTRTTTRTFTLTLNGKTSAPEAGRLLNVLQDRGQTGLLEAIDDQDLGRFSIGGRLGPRINAVMVEDVGSMKRIRAVFARWMTFAELRGGYRSVDYPFGYIEIMIDPRTGRGDGTYIAAARIRFRAERNEVEIEDFGTFPGRLMGVRMTGGQLP